MGNGVDRLLIENGTVKGAILKNGKKIYANIVVVNADPWRLVGEWTLLLLVLLCHCLSFYQIIYDCLVSPLF